MSVTDGELVEVRLLGLPPALAREASEHFDELSREFLHLANADESVRRDVPGRLLALSNDLRARFSGFTDSNESRVDEAAERGEEAIDLIYRVPAQAGPTAEELGVLLEEADRYCEGGEYLLTMRTPPGPRVYRCWYIRQFVDQINGAPPVRFADWPQPEA